MSDVYPRAAEKMWRGFGGPENTCIQYILKNLETVGEWGIINNFPGQDWTAPGSFIRFFEQLSWVNTTFCTEKNTRQLTQAKSIINIHPTVAMRTKHNYVEGKKDRRDPSDQ